MVDINRIRITQKDRIADPMNFSRPAIAFIFLVSLGWLYFSWRTLSEFRLALLISGIIGGSAAGLHPHGLLMIALFYILFLLFVPRRDQELEIYEHGVLELIHPSFSLDEKQRIRRSHPDILIIEREFRERFLNAGESIEANELGRRLSALLGIPIKSLGRVEATFNHSRFDIFELDWTSP